VSFAALAFPPFNPPSLPNATAAGFLAGFAPPWLVACGTTANAVSFMSLLERLGMTHRRAGQSSIQAEIE
jgi:hypothetical protein